MEEYPENGKESSHSAHAKGMNEIVIQVFEILFHLFSNHDQYKWETAEITTLNHTVFNCQTQGEANKVCHLATKPLHHHHHSHYLTHAKHCVSSGKLLLLYIQKTLHYFCYFFFLGTNVPGIVCIKNKNADWLMQNNTSRNNTSHIIIQGVTGGMCETSGECSLC